MGRGLLVAGGNDLVDRVRERARQEGPVRYENAVEEPTGRHYDLKAHLERLWQAARDAKEMHWQRVGEECKRRRKGEYSDAKLAEIRKHGGSEIWMQITGTKCRAAEAWVRDVLLGTGERPFGIEPTPSPTIPPEIEGAIQQQVMQELESAMANQLYVDLGAVRARMEEMKSRFLDAIDDLAKQRAERMEQEIDDMLREGGFYEALDGFISDLCTYPSAIMKGPVVQRKKKLRWLENSAGQVRAHADVQLQPIWRRVSFFDLYPSPDSTGPQDGYLWERMRITRKELHEMAGVPGYDEQAIRRLLREYRDSRAMGGDHVHDSVRDRLEGRHNNDRAVVKKFEAREYWGTLSGYLLRRWGNGLERWVDDEEAEYEVTCLIVEDEVVGIVRNDRPLEQRPYYLSSFDETPGSFWGQALPMLIADIQDVANGAGRALVNNLAIASGPQVWVDVLQLAEGENLAMRPWKIWQGQQRESGRSTQPITFFQPQSNAQELQIVFDYYQQLADEQSSIPAYTSGVNPEGGAAGTATGLSMLMNSAARGIKRVVASVDNTISACSTAAFNWQMIHNPDAGLKLDAQVVSRGSQALVMREQDAIRRIEAATMLNNPVDMQLTGLEGRRKLLEGALEAQGMNPEDILRSEDEIRLMQQMQAQQMAVADGADGEATPPEEGGGPQRPTGPRKLMADGSPSGGTDVRSFG